MSKSVKPPIIPDINSCYFGEEKENEEEDDSPLGMQSFYRPTRDLNNFSRCNIRRQSYYIHSTVQLPSFMEDRTSFLRSPSQLRMFMESSMQMNESQFQYNKETSFQVNEHSPGLNPYKNKSSFALPIDLKNQESWKIPMINKEMKRTESNKSVQALMTNLNAQANQNCSSISQSQQDGMHKTSSFTQNRIDDPFIGFDYAQPPLAEIQILRLLENHIKRKKQDQLV